MSSAIAGIMTLAGFKASSKVSVGPPSMTMILQDKFGVGYGTAGVNIAEYIIIGVELVLPSVTPIVAEAY